MIINVDLDEVVYPFTDEFTSYVTWVHGIDVDRPQQWRIHEEWGMSLEEWFGYFRLFQMDRRFRHGDPIGDSAHYMHRLSEEGHTLRIVTSRMTHKYAHARVGEDTFHWLDRHNIPFHELCFVNGRKTSKGDIAADFAIDDKPENVGDMLEAGINAFALNRPWNKGKHLPRVKDWKDFYEKVNNE